MDFRAYSAGLFLLVGAIVLPRDLHAEDKTPHPLSLAQALVPADVLSAVGSRQARRALPRQKAKVVGTPSGEKPPYHRMFEAWFESEAALGAAMGSLEGKAVVADLANFATGGVNILISAVE